MIALAKIANDLPQTFIIGWARNEHCKTIQTNSFENPTETPSSPFGEIIVQTAYL